MAAQAQKAADFRALHEGEPFVIPNPWDVGLRAGARGARLQGARHDQLRLRVHARAPRRQRHARRGRRARRAARRGDRAAASRSISRTATAPTPSTPRRRSARGARRAPSAARSRTGPGGELYGLEHAAERIAAAAEAARGLDFPFTLTARAENHIRGNPDLDDTIARLQAYERAGADVLYAPGLRSGDEIRTVCDAVSKPVNVLALPGLSMSEIVGGGRPARQRRRRRWRSSRSAPRSRRPSRSATPATSRLSARASTSRTCSAADAEARGLPARGQPGRQAQDRQRRAVLVLRGDRPGGRADVPHERERGVRRRARESKAKLSRRIEKALRDSLGFDVEVFLRTAAEVAAIAAHEPFPAKLVEASEGQAAGGPAGEEALVRRRASRCSGWPTTTTGSVFEGFELYWLPSGGMRDSAPYLKVDREACSASGRCAPRAP